MEPNAMSMREVKEMITCQICDSDTYEDITILKCFHIVCNRMSCLDRLRKPAEPAAQASAAQPSVDRPEDRWCKICKLITQPFDLLANEGNVLKQYRNVLKEIFSKLLNAVSQRCFKCRDVVPLDKIWHKCRMCALTKGQDDFKMVCSRCENHNGGDGRKHETEKYNKEADGWSFAKSMCTSSDRPHNDDTKNHVILKQHYAQLIIQRTKTTIKFLQNLKEAMRLKAGSGGTYGGILRSYLTIHENEFDKIDNLIVDEERKLNLAEMLKKHNKLQADLFAIRFSESRDLNIQLGRVFSLDLFFDREFVPYTKHLNIPNSEDILRRTQFYVPVELMYVPLLLARPRQTPRFADREVVEHFLAHQLSTVPPPIPAAEIMEGSRLRIDFLHELNSESVSFEVGCESRNISDEEYSTKLLLTKSEISRNEVAVSQGGMEDTTPSRAFNLEGDDWVISDEQGVRIVKRKDGVETLVVALTLEIYGRAIYYDHFSYVLYGLRPGTGEITKWDFKAGFIPKVATIRFTYPTQLEVYYYRVYLNGYETHVTKFNRYDTMAVSDGNTIWICLSATMREQEDGPYQGGRGFEADGFCKNENAKFTINIVYSLCYQTPYRLCTNDPLGAKIASPLLAGISSLPHVVLLDEGKPYKCLILEKRCGPGEKSRWSELSVRYITKGRNAPHVTSDPIPLYDVSFEKVDRNNYLLKIITAPRNNDDPILANWRVHTTAFSLNR